MLFLGSAQLRVCLGKLRLKLLHTAIKNCNLFSLLCSCLRFFLAGGQLSLAFSELGFQFLNTGSKGIDLLYLLGCSCLFVLLGLLQGK